MPARRSSRARGNDPDARLHTRPPSRRRRCARARRTRRRPVVRAAPRTRDRPRRARTSCRVSPDGDRTDRSRGDRRRSRRAAWRARAARGSRATVRRIPANRAAGRLERPPSTHPSVAQDHRASVSQRGALAASRRLSPQTGYRSCVCRLHESSRPSAAVPDPAMLARARTQRQASPHRPRVHSGCGGRYSICASSYSR